MARQLPHTKLINAAAKEALTPLALQRKGRSRLWLDDQGWWLGVVEFQPSSWSRGTYLNVGVDWLWGGIGMPPPSPEAARVVGWSFGFGQLGSRVLLPDGGQFVEYESDEQFEPVAHEIARAAAERVQYQRERLRTPADAAEALLAGYDVSGGRDTAIAVALAGRSEEALVALDAAEEPVRERIGTDREIAGDAAMLERDGYLRQLILTNDIASAAREAVLGIRRAAGLPENVTLPF